MPRQAKIVVYKDKAGDYRWRIVAGNGEPVAASQAYSSRHAAADSAYKVQALISNSIVVAED